MALTLAQYQTQVSALLMDPANANFTTAVIDAAVRQALSDYTNANAVQVETVLTLPGDGREIALSGLDGLIAVTDVWWPFDSDADEVWPPNRVRGFRLWWDDSQPVLFLDCNDGAQPQTDEELRLWYTRAHTVQNLDSAAVTSVIASHEQMIVRGACGLCCLGRAADLNETPVNMAVSTPNYAAMASLYLRSPEMGFYPWLDWLRSQSLVRGASFGMGWQLDKWDSVRVWGDV